MDKFDQKIQKIFIENLNPPKNYYNVVKNTIDNIEYKQENHKNMIFKFVASFILTIIMASGMVYAGIEFYKKIWKKPLEIVSSDFEITDEDKSIVLDNTILEKNAIAELDKLGYKVITIKEHEIVKDTYYDKLYYHVKANSQESEDELNIILDAKSGTFISFSILNENQPTQYRSTINEAKETSQKLLLDLNLITDEYEIIDAYGNFINENEDQSSSYQIKFAKVYDKVINNYQEVCIKFIPVINKIILLNVMNEDFDDNPIEISESNARKIAENKNSELFKDLEVDSTEISLEIEKMNEKIYIKENEIDEKTTFKIKDSEATILGDKYKKNLKTRRVYTVKFNYKENSNKYIYTQYFVDATTGEIIGGKIEHLKEMIN